MPEGSADRQFRIRIIARRKEIVMLRFCLALLLAMAAPLAAQPTNPQIDYRGFQRLAAEVQPYRQSRLIDWAAFAAMAAAPSTPIPHARSRSAFPPRPIRGA